MYINSILYKFYHSKKWDTQPHQNILIKSITQQNDLFAHRQTNLQRLYKQRNSNNKKDGETLKVIRVKEIIFIHSMQVWVLLWFLPSPFPTYYNLVRELLLFSASARCLHHSSPIWLSRRLAGKEREAVSHITTSADCNRDKSR